MNEIEIRSFCEDQLSLTVISESSSYTDKTEINFECPFCADGKPNHFYIESEKGLWKCHKCEECGNLLNLVSKLHEIGCLDDDSAREAEEIVQKDRKEKMREVFRAKAVVHESSTTSPAVEIQSIWQATVEFCHKNMERSERSKLERRVSSKTVDRFKLGVSLASLPEQLLSLGFDRKLCLEAGVVREHKRKLKTKWKNAFVIPYWENSRVVGIEYRLRDEALIVKYGKYAVPEGSRRDLFNVDTLKSSEHIYIAEGAIDAMTLVENDFPSVGIPGKGTFKEHWLKKFAEAGVKKVFLILDNGEKGTDGARKSISEKLDVAGIDVINVYLPEESGDVNDFFKKDGGTLESFKRIVSEAEAEWEKTALPLSVKEYLPEFEAETRKRRGKKILGLESGFEDLTNKLSGIRGVNVLGGMPGAGKTTFALQLAWQIVELNQVPVVYVSMEMFRRELMEKIMSRLAGLTYEEVALAEIFNSEKKKALDKAWKALNRHGHLLSIVQRLDYQSLDRILTQICRLKRQFDSERAFVVFDSLQNLAAYEPKEVGKSNIKEMLDDMMRRLYDASYQIGFEALLISHLPKDAKNKHGQFIFSGSGGIDYMSDCTMRLDEKNYAEIEDDGDEEATGRPITKIRTKERAVTLSILKCRFRPPTDFNFIFDPARNLFEAS